MNNILTGKLTSRGNLNGNVNTIVFAHNYNDLTNKPQINNVTLQGNKTASELGLATPSDITVTSVNEQTGDVILSGSDIDYSVGMSLNAKIDDLEAQIQGSGVQTVNGMSGNVTLTANDINYSTGVTIKNKIDAVENEIPDIYVSSVNGTSGAVTLTGSDIEYSEGVSLTDQIDAVEGEIPVVDYPVTSVNEHTGDVSLTDDDIPHYTGTPTAGSTAYEVESLKTSKADKTQTATFTPETGVQVMHITTGYTDKQGCITGEIRFTQTANSWKDLGTLSVKPNDICQVCGVHTGTGAFLGIVRLQPTGKLQVYPVINISNDAVGFSISFITT